MHYLLNMNTIPQISYMNIHHAPADWIHPSRIAGEYIIFIIKTGSLHIKENDQQYTLKANDMIILDPAARHTGTQADLCDYYYIHFHPNVLTPFQPAKNEDLYDLLETNRNLYYWCNPYNRELYEKASVLLPKSCQLQTPSLIRKIDTCMEQAIFSSDNRAEHYKLTASSCFLQIMAALASDYSAQVRQVRQAQFSDKQLKAIRLTADFLHHNYASRISSQLLEKEISLNFDYLNRLFKKYYGSTIFRYLTTIRLHQATELLISGRYKSYEIAELTGFSDEYHFSKTFKQKMGLAPTEYISHHYGML